MTKIEWTEASWNPIVGCSIVSPGCTNCYAMKMAARLAAMAEAGRYDCNGYVVRGGHPLDHYLGTTRPSKAGSVWTGVLRQAPENILTAPLRRKKPAMYFVNSMSDLFHEDVPDEWIDRVFAVMALCPQHTFQVLTKRAARMLEYMTRPGWAPKAWHYGERMCTAQWPLPNVWLGVSAERQIEADARIPDLLATPAAVRFVSAEPLLSSLDLSEWLNDGRREGVLSPSGSRSVQSRDGRHDLATGEVDRRRRSVRPDLHAEGAGREEFSRSRQLPEGDVQGWTGQAESVSSSDRVDGRQQATDTSGVGDQPQGREQAEQRAVEPRTSYASTERTTLPHTSIPEKEIPAGGGEFVGDCDGIAGDGNQSFLEQSISFAARDRGDVWDNAIDRVCDRPTQKLVSPALNWVIVGGESGPGARPVHADWVRSIRDQCAQSGTAFFLKQWGEWVPGRVYSAGGSGGHSIHEDGQEHRGKPSHWWSGDSFDGVISTKVGKGSAGSLLDGREWKEWPTASKYDQQPTDPRHGGKIPMEPA